MGTRPLQEAAVTGALVVVFAAALARWVVALLLAAVAGWLVARTVLRPHTNRVAGVSVEHESSGASGCHWGVFVPRGFASQEI